MSTYTQILYQIVFGSKDYSGFLDQENQGLLFAYIVGMLKKRNCHPYQVGGYDNHIHIVTHISTTNNLADLLREIKKASHEMMVRDKKSFPRFQGWADRIVIYPGCDPGYWKSMLPALYKGNFTCR